MAGGNYGHAEGSAADSSSDEDPYGDRQSDQGSFSSAESPVRNDDEEYGRDNAFDGDPFSERSSHDDSNGHDDGFGFDDYGNEGTASSDRDFVPSSLKKNAEKNHFHNGIHDNTPSFADSKTDSYFSSDEAAFGDAFGGEGDFGGTFESVPPKGANEMGDTQRSDAFSFAVDDFNSRPTAKTAGFGESMGTFQSEATSILSEENFSGAFQGNSLLDDGFNASGFEESNTDFQNSAPGFTTDPFVDSGSGFTGKAFNADNAFGQASDPFFGTESFAEGDPSVEADLLPEVSVRDQIRAKAVAALENASKGEDSHSEASSDESSKGAPTVLSGPQNANEGMQGSFGGVNDKIRAKASMIGGGDTSADDDSSDQSSRGAPTVLSGPLNGNDDLNGSSRHSRGSRSSSRHSRSDIYADDARSAASGGKSTRSATRTSITSLQQSESKRKGAINGYSRDQMAKLSQSRKEQPQEADAVFEDGQDEQGERRKSKKKRKRRPPAKSGALLQLVSNVNEIMMDIEQGGDANNLDMDSTPSRLLHGFEALVGIMLQLSDELELLSTFAAKKDTAAIESLRTLLGFAEALDEMFVQLKEILHHYMQADLTEELDDFFYGMNLIVDLMCELSHRVGEKQQWTPRANTSFVTLLELLARDSLEVTCIYDDMDTPPYDLTDAIQDAWSATGHVEEVKTLLVATDLAMFRQICYEVMLSTDQWCPDTDTLMDICGIEDDMLEDIMEPSPDDPLAPIPEAALQVLDKIHGENLPRTPTMVAVIRRILPPHAVSDRTLQDHSARIRSTIRNPLGLSLSSLVSITSVGENAGDPEALGVAGVGKTTLAGMVANHPDVRRFFNDGIAWIHIGQTELNYTRYVQCLRDLVSQLVVEEDEEPLFPELLHSPGESPSKRRRREEGFMIYIRETMVAFLRGRNVMIVLDDVCFEPDLDWFDFTPAPSGPEDDPEGSCVVLITSRRRNLLPAVDTVEVDMLDEDEAVSLLIAESGELSSALMAESPETRSVVVECANHPLAVKSVGRWLNLKHATAGPANSVEEIHEDVVKSMEKILKSGNHEDADMMYEILNMSLSPAINGEPTSIIKFCFAAFVRVFCERKHISDFSLAEASPIVPLGITQTLFESLLDLEEETLLKEGSLFFAQKKEASTLIPEALSALGVFKIVITYADPIEGEGSNPNQEEEKYVQIMHIIQQEYGEYLYEEDPVLIELAKDGERRWNKAFAQSYLRQSVNWDTDTPDAALDYALEMMPSHMIRGGMFTEAASILCNGSFVRGRLFALGRENGTRRQIKDCETLFDVLVEQRAAGRKKLDPKNVMKQAYETLGGLLTMDEDEYIAEEGSPEAVEVGRSHFEIGFSLAEKRCWEAAISHWENSQELLVSSLGMVEIVAGILYDVGSVYAEMNEYEQALGSLKQCLRIRGAIHGEEHILYAQTIQKIGDIFLGMSDYHEAMESYNWALDVMHIEPSHHRIDIGDILENMGNIHYSKGEIDEALQCYQDALRSKQVDLGEDHPELANTYHHIGNCLSDQEKTDEAVAHFEEAIRLKKLDPDGAGERDADILTIEGVLHNLNGTQKEGLECYEKALQILVTRVPHKKEKVASLLHLIGCVYLMSGEHKKAMKLFEESLQARRKVLGFVHLDVASTLFNMAFLHKTRNRLDKALKCLEEALKIRQLRLPDSEKVAVTHEKIGSLARVIGKTKKAEIAFVEALRIRKQIHGSSHEAVATVLQELGDLMDDLGEYEQAMKYYVEALEIRENLLGQDDLAVAETYYSMGFTLQNNGASERALQCFDEALSIRKYQLGDDAREVGDTLNMMGFLQAKRGELDEALSLLWDALRIRKFHEDHIKVSETLKNIGNVHREKLEYDDAVECYEECLHIRRSELGHQHEKVADALIAMGNVQSDMDHKEEAMQSYKEALKTRTTLFGEQDESVAAVLHYMGALEFRSGDLDRALDLLTEFIQIRQENGTEHDGDYVNALFIMGNIHKMQGEEEEAHSRWKKAYKIFQELGLADGNPQIAEQIAEAMGGIADSSELRGTKDQKQSKGVLGRLSEKVKGASKPRRKDRGQQL